MATLHFSAPAACRAAARRPAPGQLPDPAGRPARRHRLRRGRPAARAATPEPVGRLIRLALAGEADAVVDGLRGEGFIKPDVEIDAQAVLDFLRPMLEPIAGEEFQFTRAWLRGEATRLASPKCRRSSSAGSSTCPRRTC